MKVNRNFFPKITSKREWLDLPNVKIKGKMKVEQEEGV